VGRPAARRGVPTTPYRRTRPVRRASAGLTPVRAGAVLAMLLAAAAIYGVANSSAFTYGKLRLEGVHVSETDDVEAALADVRGRNLFTLRTRPLETALGKLTAVVGASVSVRLPDTLVVHLDEREAILVWQIGARRYLVDADGGLFARLGADTPADAATLPVVEDRRAASAGLSIGRSIAPVDLDAATRLASLVPADVGSSAARLAVQVTDASGFVVRSGAKNGWSAVFGYYTPSLRTTAIIPEQVRLLRSLLIGREQLVDRVILASGTDGTYIPKPTPKPTTKPSATPKATPRATASGTPTT
jgi:hypothetical protein